MLKKSLLGQFNTTNKDYILDGLEYWVPDKCWIDPYAGNGDLLNWAKNKGALSVSGYDIDPTKKSKVVKNKDTLLNPPDYAKSFVIANPPYLARNKCRDKTLYDKYSQDDLYKISIMTTKGCDGGIFIVPLNFLSSVYANSIRDIFFEDYKIHFCKIFEESVFDDTDYTVCAFYFQKRNKKSNKDNVEVIFCPSNKKKRFHISKKYHWIFGEEFYEYIDAVSAKGIGRWTIKNGMSGYTFKTEEEKEAKNAERGTIYINDFISTPIKKGGDTDHYIISGPKQDAYFCRDVLKDIILVRAIDTGTNEGRIGLCDIRKLVKDNKQPILMGLETSRNLAHVRFENHLSIETQLRIIDGVNNKLEMYRREYNSVFLTSFRNSTEAYSRKRISFEVVYKMIARELQEINDGSVIHFSLFKS